MITEVQTALIAGSFTLIGAAITFFQNIYATRKATAEAQRNYLQGKRDTIYAELLSKCDETTREYIFPPPKGAPDPFAHKADELMKYFETHDGLILLYCSRQVHETLLDLVACIGLCKGEPRDSEKNLELLSLQARLFTRMQKDLGIKV